MVFNPLVLIGAAGWQYPAWRSRFYPADMPDDWMLSYYNTQFHAVYLPALVWKSVSEATWAEWLHDTLDEFYFVLEPAGVDAVKPASKRVVLATPAWEAEHVWWLEKTPDLRLLSQRIVGQAATGEPLFVFSRSGNLDLMGQVDTLRQVLGY